MASLLLEFFEYYELDYTMSVFLAEARMPSTAKQSREAVALSTGADSRHNGPLLGAFLQRGKSTSQSRLSNVPASQV